MFSRFKALVRRRKAVRANVRLGDRFSCGHNSTVWGPRSLTIGNNVGLGSDVRIEVDGVIGDHVLIANATAIVGRDDHDSSEVGVSIREARWVGNFPEELSHFTIIGSDVWLGYGTIVLSGVTIGDSTIVGAGSVVTKSLPPNSIAVGNPARVIATRFDDETFLEHWGKLSKAGVSRIAPALPTDP